MLRDLSGQGNHGTLTNMDPATDWVVSEGKQALDFDGVNDYVNIVNGRILRVQEMTVCGWVNLRTLGASEDSRAIITTVGNYSWYLTAGAGKANFYRGGPFTWLVGINSFGANSWAHIAATWDKVRRSVFLNGILDNTVNDSSLADYSTHTGFYIGQRGDGVGANGINGQLDDIRIYNRALSASEIRLLASERGIGLKPERSRRYAQGQTFTAARLRRQSLIGSGVY